MPRRVHHSRIVSGESGVIEEGGAQGDEAAIAGHGEGKAHFGEQGELVEQDGNHPGHGAGLLIVAGLRGECVDEFADEGRNLHGVVALKPGAGGEDMRHDVQGIVHGRLRECTIHGSAREGSTRPSAAARHSCRVRYR